MIICDVTPRKQTRKTDYFTGRLTYLLTIIQTTETTRTRSAWQSQT